MLGAVRSILRATALLALAPLPALAQGTRICAIQGSSDTPIILGTRVSVAGVVTADFSSRLGGFFLQEPGCDTDPGTSDGIFVSTGGRAVAVTAGNRVTVTGRVTNDGGLTAIALETVTDGGLYAGSLEAVRLAPPASAADAAAYLESYEAMLVSLPPSRVVAATGRSGESYVMPESSGVTRLFRGDSDGRKLGLAAPAGWLALNQGDRVGDVTGVLTYADGHFEVLVPPGRSVTVERSGALPPESGATAPSVLSVASYDLDDLVDAVDDPGKNDDVATPEVYAASLARRAASIARYLGLPDVLGVQEVEKVEVLQDLAAQPALLPARYREVLVEGPDPRGLDVGLLYNSQRLWLRSAEARPGPLFERPPLLVRLEALDNHERLTVIVNHFREASSDPAADAQVRLAQADAVRALVDELKSAEPDVPVVVLGDLNDSEDSPTLAHLTAGGRLINPMVRTAVDRPYTAALQGLCQPLDYVLFDASLAPRVVEARPLHVNVDFGDAGPTAPPEAGPRASGHDPVRLLLARP